MSAMPGIGFGLDFLKAEANGPGGFELNMLSELLPSAMW
jgi:hypothetical protein